MKASPYAKKLAEKAGISLDGIAGSGPDGRIVADDVDKAVASGKVGDCPDWTSNWTSRCGEGVTVTHAVQQGSRGEYVSRPCLD